MTQTEIGRRTGGPGGEEADGDESDMDPFHHEKTLIALS